MKRECFRNKLLNPTIKIVANSYKKHIKKLRKLNRKIRICFYVSENQKWKSQSLFDELKKNDLFDVFAVFAPRTREQSLTKDAISIDFGFFKEKITPIYLGYDIEKKEYKDLKDYNPDIIFYSQPWDIPTVNSIENVSKYALTCYIPYAIAEAITPMLKNVYSFHYLLWRHYTAHKLINKQYNKAIPYVTNNLKAVGYPILNEIINNNLELKEELYNNCIIYAPHHSFNGSWLQYGTFDWNGEYILEYAKKHPEFKWVFRPHPDFKNAVINNNIMTESEINNYFAEWHKIGIFYDKGDYVDLFKQSKCLITDCGSFITEYFVTKKPLIHLRNSNAKDYNGLNNVIKESLYKAYNLDELKIALENILEKNDDKQLSSRLKLFEELNFDKSNSVINIVNDLIGVIKQ